MVDHSRPRAGESRRRNLISVHARVRTRDADHERGAESPRRMEVHRGSRQLERQHLLVRSKRAQGETGLTFVQVYAQELSDEVYGTYNFNWGYYLGSLKSLCETGTGTPFQASSSKY